MSSSTPSFTHRASPSPAARYLADAPFAPTYDRSELTVGIVHFGLGNFHRAHQALYLDQLMSQGEALDWAICGVGIMPADARMRDVMNSQDGLYTLVLEHTDGTHEPHVIGSVADYLFAPDDPDKVLDRMTAPSTRIVSLTVTEGGYNINDETQEFNTENPDAVHDAQHPSAPTTTFGFIVEALRRRRDAGIAPFTVMSCDNLPGNGHVAKNSVLAQARMTDPELADWIESEVAFPNCMVDRITPVTTPAVGSMIEQDYGYHDAWPVVAEPFGQWVLEDRFTLGRPPFEDAGVQMVDDVVPYELMKLRLLNASHQFLAHWGRLLGLEYAHDAAQDPDIVAFTRAYLDREVLPTLRPVPGIDLTAYVDTLFERFANPEIADTLARLAQDASDRMPKFVLPTIRDNLAAGRSIALGAATCAAWALGMEIAVEPGAPITLDDKQAERLFLLIGRQKDGEAGALIGDTQIFGTLGSSDVFADAFESSLAAIRSEGARATLKKAVSAL